LGLTANPGEAGAAADAWAGAGSALAAGALWAHPAMTKTINRVSNTTERLFIFTSSGNTNCLVLFYFISMENYKLMNRF
jgi:hypothetical protein